MDASKMEAQLRQAQLRDVTTTGKELGRGSYGRVLEVKVGDTFYAAKEIHSILLESVSAKEFETIKRSFLMECINCSKIRHPNIVQMLGVHYPTQETGVLPWLVMELMDTSLTQFLVDKQQDVVALNIKISMLVDISEGLRYLHSQDILHRDLSSNNILLTKDLVAKIADLGVAKVVKQSKTMTQTRAPGTVHFMPPEALSVKSHYSKPVDVFSLACVALHIMSHQWPEPKDQVELVNNSVVAHTEVQRRDNYLEYCTPPSLKALIELCLNNDAKQRPDISIVHRELNKILKELSQRRERSDSGSQSSSQSLQFNYKQILGTFKNLPWSIMKITTQAFSFDSGDDPPTPARLEKSNSNEDILEEMSENELLETAHSKVDEITHKMTHDMSNKQLTDVLKHVATIFGELKTTLLTAKNYFELFTYIFHRLHPLEQFLTNVLKEEKAKGATVELHELVNCIDDNLPRLYLLITVSMVYVKLEMRSKRDTFKSLEKMCFQVKHPLRGLFLRYYLLRCSKDVLPDTGSESDSDGTVDDSVYFILVNFAEMNKLWIQYQEECQGKEQLEEEQMELCILVGTNLVRLSQLEGIDVDKYKIYVVHYIMEQVTTCQNVMAQDHLMDYIIQAFPDEYHLDTLDILLKYCGELQPQVDFKNIFVCLMNRIATYTHHCATIGAPVSLPLFDMFSEKLSQIIPTCLDMLLEDILAMLVSLINLALKVYPDHIDYVDKVLCSTVELLQQRNIFQVDGNSIAGEELTRLVMMLLENYDDTLCVLQLEYYPKMLQLFDYQGRKQLAVHLATTIVEKYMYITTPDALRSLFNLLSPLIQDQSDQLKEPLHNNEDFCEEQWLMARLVHLLKADVTDQQYMMLHTARESFNTGGDQRIMYTLPPLVFAAYRLVKTYQGLQEEDNRWQKKSKKIFKFCHETIFALNKIGPEFGQRLEICLSLFLQGALTADQIQDETITYGFVNQAMSLCEEDALDKKARCDGIMLIVSVVEQLTCLGEENLKTISTKLTVSCSNLPEKADQCRGVALCAHLFWSGKVISPEDPTECGDGKRVVECLRRSGRIAVTCEDTLELKAQLLVELLNKYMYFYEQENDEITSTMVERLIEMVKEAVTKLSDSEEANMIKTHFANAISHIKRLKSSKDSSYYDDTVV
ncbi:vacuolar protein sorting-associated protein 35-like isoform X2 [Dysidea avara]|uniref:vacuolar protein sorting-associated protein 35-like isoform X2 n=1 Tax=Dysidea avara TaxID=196820 RepID=UPI003317423F